MLKVLVLYHYLHPDDVVSAKHLTDLCVGLQERGWDVTAIPCNRGCRDESLLFDERETYKGVNIRRVWRPRFRQASILGRILNSLWMQLAWTAIAIRERNRYDILIIGTDPIFSILVSIPWRLISRKTKVVHWCFDMHPETAVADGLVGEDWFLVKSIRRLLKRAYKSCSLIVDIGPCMRSLLKTYAPEASYATLTPWALAEPDRALKVDRKERQNVFGDARLGLLYSGNFGRAHTYKEIIELAGELEDTNIKFAFSVRGNKADELRNAVMENQKNISLIDFAPFEKLQLRLSCADIHMVSLHESWTGTVVPSKFQGALAIGRPILFVGSRESAIARWIREYEIGWVLDMESVQMVAERLRSLADNPDELLVIMNRCFNVYQEVFSRENVIDCWNGELRELCSIGWK